MKRRFVLMLAAVLVIALAACVFVACNPKTEGNGDVTVTFNRNGLGEDVTLSGAPGKDISDSLPNPNSTQAYYFGGWYDNAELEGDPVQLPSALPAENKTYYARWYRKYSVSVLLEKADGTFEESEELSFEGEVDKGEDSVTLTVETPPDFVDVNASKTFELNGRDCEFSLKYELSSVRLTFDFNGEGDNVIVEEKRGTDISPKLPSAADTEGYYFGGWYLDAAFSQTVDDMTVMPQAETTYFARWYRTYKVAAYVQNEDHTAYEFSSEKSYQTNKGSENVTVKAADFDALASYLQPADTTFNVATKNESVCELHFDRDDVSVTYQIGEAGEDITDYNARGGDYTIGLAEDVLDELYANGFRFVCYSLDGQNPIDSAQVKSDEDLTVKVLFDKAYTERNGSDDLLWLPKGEEGKAYLSRKYVEELEGSFNSDTKMFSFLEGALVGRVYDDGTFATQREGVVPFYLYDYETSTMLSGVELSLDWLDKATLKVGQDGADLLATFADVDGVPTLVTVPVGEYACTYRGDLDFNDYYVTVPLAGGAIDLHFLTGEYESKDGVTHDIFVLRGVEFGFYKDDSATVFLDGYDTAYYIIDDGYFLGEYEEVSIDEHLSDKTEIMTLFGEGDSQVALYLLMGEFTSFDEGIPSQPINRYDDFSGTFSESDPFTHQGSYGELYVSGYGFALLGSNSKTRYDYEVQMNGMLTPYGVNWLKLYDPETHEYKKDVFFSESPNYYFEMPRGAEFKFIVDFSQPTDLLYFASATEVHYYTYDLDYETLMYNLGDDGTLAEAGVDAQGRKLYSVTFSDSDMDFKFFELETDGVVTCYREGTLVYNGDYTAKDGSTLTLNNFGEALYTGLDGIAHYGRYYNFDGVTTFVCDDEQCPVYFDFTIDGDSFAIVEYTDMPSDTLYHFVLIQDESGQQVLSYNALMTIEENLNASIEIPLTEEKSITVTGKISLADAINFYFLFTVEEVSGTYPNSFVEALSHDFLFNLIGYSTQQGDMYGFALSDGFEKSYKLDDGSVFTVDGFGFATYKDADGNGSVGGYEVYHETTYVAGIQHIHYIFDFIDAYGNETLFDLWDDGSLTKRGDEYSWYGYYIYDGVNYYNYLIFPDGNGNLDFVYYDNGMLYMATAKYTLNGNYGTMTDVEYTYWVPMENFTQEECDALNLLAEWLQGMFEIYDGGTYDFKLVKVGEEDCFMILDDGVKDAFVFGDMSVLKTDGFNEAVYTDKYGDSYGGTFATEYYSADQGETMMILIRFYSAYLGEKAFLITDELSLEVGTEFGNYSAGDDSVFLDGRGAVTYTFGGETKEANYTFDPSTGIVSVTQAEGGDFKIKVKAGEKGKTFVVCDETLAGVYNEADRDGNTLDAVLTMDGMGNAQIMENGVLTRYDVAHVELTVYRLTNILDEYDTIDVKLDLDAHTFRRSDGNTILDETQLFDFTNGFVIDPERSLMIDSFDIVYIGGEVAGSLLRQETDNKGSYGTIQFFYVKLTDGTEKTFCQFMAGPFPRPDGIYNFHYAYTEYDASTEGVFTHEAGDDLTLTGFGRGTFGNQNIIYWVEDGYICTCDLWDQYKATRMFELNATDHTYEEVTVDNKLFKVEDGVLVQYLGQDSRIIIPKDMGIVEIGEGVFSYASLGYYVRGIDFSDTVEIIGKNAFYPENATALGVDTLAEVRGTAKIRIIRGNAFYLADITSIELPSIELIEAGAFYGTTKLESVVLGNDAESWSIGEKAFVSGSSISAYSNKHFTVTITAPHAPMLGESAFNNANATLNTTGTNIKEIKFTQAAAWAEAQDEGTEIGVSWAQYFAETAETYKLSGPDDAAAASLEANTVDAYFEDKRK